MIHACAHTPIRQNRSAVATATHRSFGRDTIRMPSTAFAPRRHAPSEPIVRASENGHEREADRIADRVTRSDGGRFDRRAGTATTPLRADGESTVPAAVDETLRSPGRPLDRTTRSFMESRFGHDFGRVRIHTGATAAASAETIGALAYTVGRNIVFGPGRYEPESAAGKHLLAHELTHVLQQNSGAASPSIQRREKPGTSGRTSANECYVVYDREIKVGGKPCWRFNNPGNVGREPSAKTDPTGALNHIGGGVDCGAGVGLFIFDEPASGLLEIGARLTKAAQKQRFVCEFLLSFSHEGQKYLTEISNRCTFLKGKLPTAERCGQEKGPNLGNLTEEQLECIWGAIADVECSYSGTYSSVNAGTTFRCGDTGLPTDLGEKLGC